MKNWRGLYGIAPRILRLLAIWHATVELIQYSTGIIGKYISTRCATCIPERPYNAMVSRRTIIIDTIMHVCIGEKHRIRFSENKEKELVAMDAAVYAYRAAIIHGILMPAVTERIKHGGFTT